MSSALFHAARTGDLATLQARVVVANVNVKDRSGRTMLYHAALGRRIAVMDWLYEHGGEVNVKVDKGWTLAFDASKHGHVEVVEWFHKHDGDMNATDHDGRNVAHVAAIYQRLPVLQLLRRFGVDVEAKNKAGETATHLAARLGNIEMLDWLQEHGADMSVKANDGWTVAHYAAAGKKLEVLQWLHQRGYNISSKDNEGMTPAHHAVSLGRYSLTPVPEILKWLHQEGYAIDEKDNAGRTPANIAGLQKKLHVLEVFAARGFLDAAFVQHAVETDAPELVAWLHDHGYAVAPAPGSRAAQEFRLLGYDIPTVAPCDVYCAVHEFLGRRAPAPQSRSSALVSQVLDVLAQDACTPLSRHNVDLLINSVFLPLARITETPTEIRAFFNALSTIVARTITPPVQNTVSPREMRPPLEETTDEADLAGTQDAFATPSIRDEIFVSLSNGNPQYTEQMFRAMYYITQGDDDGAVRRRNIFATPEVRDRVFLRARAEAAISHDTAEWMFRAMNNLVRGTDKDVATRRDIFATEHVRTQLFIPFAQHAIFADDAEAAPEHLFRAMRSIVDGDDPGAGARRDLFATMEMRDSVFVPFAERSTGSRPSAAATVGSMAAAVDGITGGADPHAADRRNLFASPLVRDCIFIPLAARAAVDPEASESLLRAMANITDGTDAAAGNRRDVFATEAVRDNIFGVLARRTSRTPRLCVEALEAMTRGTDAAADQRRAVLSHGSFSSYDEAMRARGFTDQNLPDGPAVSSSGSRGSFSSYDAALRAWGFTDRPDEGSGSHVGDSESTGRYTDLVAEVAQQSQIPTWPEAPAMRGVDRSDARSPETESTGRYTDLVAQADRDGRIPTWSEVLGPDHDQTASTLSVVGDIQTSGRGAAYPAGSGAMPSHLPDNEGEL